MNRYECTANLTRDPELRETQSGAKVCRLRVAVSDRVQDKASGEWKDKPNYFNVAVFGKRGESCERFLEKGSKVAIAGRLSWREYEAKDGGRREAVEIVAEEIEFLSFKERREQAKEPDAFEQAKDALGGEFIDESIPF